MGDERNTVLVQDSYLSSRRRMSQNARCSKSDERHSLRTSKTAGEMENARQDFFGIFGRTARLFQNSLLKHVRWPQKKRQNLFGKAARLFRNLHTCRFRNCSAAAAKHSGISCLAMFFRNRLDRPGLASDNLLNYATGRVCQAAVHALLARWLPGSYVRYHDGFFLVGCCGREPRKNFIFAEENLL